MKPGQKIFTALALGPWLLAGCAVGPDYVRPAVTAPAAWKETEPVAAAPAVTLPTEWWRIFEDPVLDSLEAQVVTANQDLQRAAGRVAEARALARLSAAELLPKVDAHNGLVRQRTTDAATSSRYQAQVDLSYELDLWGRARRSDEAARAEAAATGHDLQAMLLAVTAEAASQYLQLRSLEAEMVVVKATIALRRDAVGLQETRSAAGLINEVDVTRARTELASVEAEYHALARARARHEHALAVLCGQSPARFAVAVSAAGFSTPAVPAGLPATLLQRRPDVAAAEEQIRAANARIGVAKAEFFPAISLTGSAGFASRDLGSLLEGGNRTWSIGPGVHLPVFDGGRNHANLAASEARYEQAVAAYRGTVLNAFREVEDALSDLGTLAEQGDAVARALHAARDTAALTTERYQKGLSSYLEVVDAQRTALQAERQDTQLRAQRAISTILLAKAVGGGWEPAAARL